MAFLAIGIIFYACSKNQKTIAHLQLVHQSARITRLTQATQHFGITGLNTVRLQPDAISITIDQDNIVTPKAFTYTKISESQVRLVLTEDQKTTSLFLDKDNGTVLFEELNIDIAADNAPELSIDEQTRAALSITLYFELTVQSFPRTDPEPQRPRLSCELAAMSFRYTKSSAEEHVTAFANKYIAGHPGCRKQYGVDTGCAWGDFMCVAVQQITCCK